MKQKKVFTSYPFKKQYEIYIHATREVHPPALWIQDFIASNGDKIFGDLIYIIKITGELNYDEQWSNIDPVLDILYEMKLRKIYNFHDDDVIIVEINKQLPGIVFDSVRGYIKHKLSCIVYGGSISEYHSYRFATPPPETKPPFSIPAEER